MEPRKIIPGALVRNLTKSIVLKTYTFVRNLIIVKEQ
jgi:hypothetical protein